MRRKDPSGASLIEVMFVVSILVTLTGIAVPGMLTGLDDSRARAAAKYLAGQFGLARMQAVSRSTYVAVKFDFDGTTHRYAFYEDGNSNGVRTRDIRRGIDRRTTPVEAIGDRFPGVRFGVAAGVTDISSGKKLVGDPVRMGRSDIVSFGPAGTATSGTVYVRSRSGRQYAVRVLGATGRVRVLGFNVEMGKWLPE